MSGPWQVSTAPVINTVRWLPVGHSIVYQDAPRGVFVRARIEFDPTFRVDRADIPPDRIGNFINDVHPDGRILFNRPVGVVGGGAMDELHPTLVVVANWFTELRSRLDEANR
jgi:hypothetical protein